MRPAIHLPTAAGRPARAFTLPEIMVVMAIFSLLVAALISSQIFGLKMSRITESRLTSTDNSRKVLSRIRLEILSSKTMVVGNGDSRSFTPIANNTFQIGNALQIYPTTDTTKYVRYYVWTNDQTFQRLTSDNPTPEVLANAVTNLVAFQAEDYQGNISTSSQNSRTVRMLLEFYRRELQAPVGQPGAADYYRLQTRVTRRLIE